MDLPEFVPQELLGQVYDVVGTDFEFAYCTGYTGEDVNPGRPPSERKNVPPSATVPAESRARSTRGSDRRTWHESRWSRCGSPEYESANPDTDNWARTTEAGTAVTTSVEVWRAEAW